MVTLLRERPLVLVGWALAAALFYPFLGLDLVRALASPIWQVGDGTLLGRDFANVYTAGHLVLGGPLHQIYDIEAYRAYQEQLFHGAVLGHNYSYTPVSFFYVWLFAPFPYLVALGLWLVLTGGAFLRAARPSLRDAGQPAWLALVLPASLMNIWAGHYGFLFGAIWLAAWRLLEPRPRLGGLLIGLMIVKPHLALLMPIVLVRRGAWTAFLFAALTASGLVLASGLAFGWTYWAAYVSDTLFAQAAMIGDTSQFFVRMMPTAAPSFLLAGLPSWAAWGLQGAAAVAAVAALLWFMPKEPGRAGLATACATFLVLPYAFVYDMTVVSLAALLVLERGGAAMRPFWRAVSVLAFLLPAMAVSVNDAGVPAGPVLIGFLLFRLLRAPLAGAEPIPPPG
ncbi:MAG TPA: glycosyltransferase family 87 protein [Allosphingosinicella sp.]|nr:glycosyltransferase family 87 protein [Allosphingosinicella sp.]